MIQSSNAKSHMSNLCMLYKLHHTVLGMIASSAHRHIFVHCWNTLRQKGYGWRIPDRAATLFLADTRTIWDSTTEIQSLW